MNTLKPAIRQLFVLAFATALFSVGCKKDDAPPQPQPTMEMLYDQSITDAMVADSSEVIDTLWPVKPDNQQLQWKTINGQSYVLAATFMRFPGSYPAGDSISNTWGESWVFIPAQMKGKLGPGLNPSSDTIQRICQLLGLPPRNGRSNTHIAEIWVRPEQLVRPAGNPAINTTSAGAALVGNTTAWYSNWFNGNIIYSYYHTLQSATDYHYPWTRLGYTYDWAPDASSEVGLSEYVLQPSSGIWVEKVQTAGDFFR